MRGTGRPYGYGFKYYILLPSRKTKHKSVKLECGYFEDGLVKGQQMICNNLNAYKPIMKIKEGLFHKGNLI